MTLGDPAAGVRRSVRCSRAAAGGVGRHAGVVDRLRLAQGARRARCSSRCAACNADGAAFAREAHRPRRDRRRRRSRRRPADVAAPWMQVPRRAARAGGAGRDRSTAIRASELTLVGITGTNGKTTTSYLLGVDLRGRRHPVRPDRHRRLPHRRPRSSTRRGRRRRRRSCSAMLREMVTQGCGACVMEVSSHALALQRADHLRFAAGDLHQPDARSPRLPRRHGDVLRRQAAAVRAAAGAARRR